MRAGRFIRRSALAVAMLLLALPPFGCASTAVSVNEPQPVGTSQRPVFRNGDVERIAVMSAVPAELDRLLDAARIETTVTIVGREHHIGRLEGHPVVLMLVGVSMVNAAMATQALIDHFPVSAIVFSGIAGGVNPGLSVGDVTVPARWGQFQEAVYARELDDGWDRGGRAGQFPNFEMMFPRGQLLDGGGPGAQPDRRRFWFPTDDAMRQVAERLAGESSLARCTESGSCLEHEPRIVVGGNGLSGAVFVDNAAFREYLWETFDADAVDMETAAVAHVAHLNEVPFLAFRSLSDLAGGGPGANEIETFGYLAADNSAAVLRRFLSEWRGPR
jgi:adenosylhomocysteine nucleosidase